MPIMLTTAGDILLQTLWGQWQAFVNKLNLKHSSLELFFMYFSSLSTPILCVASQGGSTSNKPWCVISYLSIKYP